jgi:hypothetical protein
LGVERGAAPFLTLRFCQSERRIRVQDTAGLLSLPSRAGLGPHRGNAQVVRGRLGVVSTLTMSGSGGILAGGGHGWGGCSSAAALAGVQLAVRWLKCPEDPTSPSLSGPRPLN